MRNLTICSAVLALLSGCSIVPASAWNFDPTQPQAKRTIPIEESVALTDRLAQLQIQRNDVRGRIASERDIRARQRLYAQLHSIGSELAPLERELSTVAAAR